MKATKNANNAIGNDLENATEKMNLLTPSAKIIDFQNREWLEKENPIDFCTNENVSSKFDLERENSIQKGLPLVVETKLNNVSINPLLILLGKWWEVKPVRANIKKMIDAEADAKGIDKDVYLQINLAKEVDAFTEMQSAIDRIRYAKTYFKPRKPLSDKVITKPVNIDGIVYIVPVQAFEALKSEFAGNREGLKNATIAISKIQNLDVEEL